VRALAAQTGDEGVDLVAPDEPLPGSVELARMP